jgi:uncharacterized protein
MTILNTLTRLLALVCLMLNTGVWAASDSQNQLLQVTSPQFEGRADFKITLPPGYGKQVDKRYVLLLDFHPRSQAYLSGMHDWMSHNGEWPWLETILVTAPDGHEGLGRLKQAAIEERGNQKLLDFIEQDLLSAIDKQYRTNGFRILNGFTGNAGLSLYTLLNRPQLFNAYIAASPVLSDDFAFLLQDAPKRLAVIEGKPRFLFMSTSDSDFEQAQLADFARMEAMLKQYAGPALTWQAQRFDGSYYMTQPILATAHGIEALFDDIHQVLEPDSAISRRGPEAILAHYRYLSQEKYGFEVPATDSLIALAKSLEASQPQKAIDVYRQAIAAYPDAAAALHSLAGHYAAMGQLEQAIEYETRALAKTDHPFWRDLYGRQLAGYRAGNPESLR